MDSVFDTCFIHRRCRIDAVVGASLYGAQEKRRFEIYVYGVSGELTRFAYAKAAFDRLRRLRRRNKEVRT